MQTTRRVLYLPDDLWLRLTAEAERMGCSASFIARETLEARLQPQQPVSEQARQLAYDMAFDRAIPPRAHVPGAGQIRLPNGQVVDLPPGIDAMALGRAPETREQE